jgi:hypothetical protein
MTLPVLLQRVESNRKVICFYKIAPVAIFLAAACIKVAVHDLVPYRGDLFFHGCCICIRNGESEF